MSALTHWRTLRKKEEDRVLVGLEIQLHDSARWKKNLVLKRKTKGIESIRSRSVRPDELVGESTECLVSQRKGNLFLTWWKVSSMSEIRGFHSKAVTEIWMKKGCGPRGSKGSRDQLIINCCRANCLCWDKKINGWGSEQQQQMMNRLSCWTWGWVNTKFGCGCWRSTDSKEILSYPAWGRHG